MPWREEYGGCTSWVDLDDLPGRSHDASVGAGVVRRRVRRAVRRARSRRFPRSRNRPADGRAPSRTRERGAPEGAPRLEDCWKVRQTALVGGTSSHPSRRRCGGQTPQAAQRYSKPGLAAAHLQGPVLFMHVWTTSFPWYATCSTSTVAHRDDGFPPRRLRGRRRRSPCRYASCVSSTPCTCSGRYDSPVAADCSRMKATVSAPPITTVPGRVLGRTVRRHALALEELQLEVEDAAHVVGREGCRHVIG